MARRKITKHDRHVDRMNGRKAARAAHRKRSHRRK
jgi:hypothetical protein